MREFLTIIENISNTNLTLVHYSSQPLTRVILPSSQKIGMKPNGLWVSVKDSWKKWVDSEDYRTNDDWKYVTQVILKPSAKILYMGNDGLKSFEDKFGIHDGDKVEYINWPEICKLYDGFILTDYRYNNPYYGVVNPAWYRDDKIREKLDAIDDEIEELEPDDADYNSLADEYNELAKKIGEKHRYPIREETDD